jgi:hypothetical protein
MNWTSTGIESSNDEVGNYVRVYMPTFTLSLLKTSQNPIDDLELLNGTTSGITRIAGSYNFNDIIATANGMNISVFGVTIQRFASEIIFVLNLDVLPPTVISIGNISGVNAISDGSSLTSNINVINSVALGNVNTNTTPNEIFFPSKEFWVEKKSNEQIIYHTVAPTIIPPPVIPSPWTPSGIESTTPVSGNYIKITLPSVTIVLNKNIGINYNIDELATYITQSGTNLIMNERGLFERSAVWYAYGTNVTININNLLFKIYRFYIDVENIDNIQNYTDANINVLKDGDILSNSNNEEYILFSSDELNIEINASNTIATIRCPEKTFWLEYVTTRGPNAFTYHELPPTLSHSSRKKCVKRNPNELRLARRRNEKNGCVQFY